MYWKNSKICKSIAFIMLFYSLIGNSAVLQGQAKRVLDTLIVVDLHTVADSLKVLHDLEKEAVKVKLSFTIRVPSIFCGKNFSIPIRFRSDSTWLFHIYSVYANRGHGSPQKGEQQLILNNYQDWYITQSGADDDNFCGDCADACRAGHMLAWTGGMFCSKLTERYMPKLVTIYFDFIYVYEE